MAFTLHSRARTWFGIRDQRGFARSLDPATKDSAPRFLMFDAYYCCLMAGLDGERHGRVEDLEPSEFAKVYPEAYRGQAELSAGLLVDAELRRQEIAPGDRQSIEAEMVRLLDLKSSTRLSADGDDLLNLYAASGFEKIEGAIAAPDNLEDFLVAYHRMWNANG